MKIPMLPSEYYNLLNLLRVCIAERQDDFVLKHFLLGPKGRELLAKTERSIEQHGRYSRSCGSPTSNGHRQGRMGDNILVAPYLGSSRF